MTEPFDSRKEAIEGILRILGDSVNTVALNEVIEAEGAELLPLRREFSRQMNKINASRLVLGRLLEANEEVLRKLYYRDGDWSLSVHHKYEFYLQRMAELGKSASHIYENLPKEKKIERNDVPQRSEPSPKPSKRTKRTPAPECATPGSSVQHASKDVKPVRGRPKGTKKVK